ncbi:MAG: biopolymer transporter ExbD [Kangiellaceae bacterium]|nr:biopolymer transporter ExbD [Kangiellaceae bacterium]
MQRHHSRWKVPGLNLVSLMDIFTILVFFLLVNSSDVQEVPNSKIVTLPDSSSEQKPKENLILLVNNEQILVQGKVIANVEDILQSDAKTIPALQDELNFRAKQKHAVQASLNEPLAEQFDITIMGDKQIPYRLLQKIMRTCSENNFSEISLAVVHRSEVAS